MGNGNLVATSWQLQPQLFDIFEFPFPSGEAIPVSTSFYTDKRLFPKLTFVVLFVTIHFLCTDKCAGMEAFLGG